MARPKDLGGLGIPDLEKFGRALRLRWLWQDWVEESKPWVGAELPCNETDRYSLQLINLNHDRRQHKSSLLAQQLARGEGTQEFGTTLVRAG